LVETLNAQNIETKIIWLNSYLFEKTVNNYIGVSAERDAIFETLKNKLYRC